MAVALKRHAPKQWEDFVEAYYGLFQAEFDRSMASTSTEHGPLAYWKGRLSFSDTLGDTLMNVDEMFRMIETRERAQAEAEAIKREADGARNS